MLYLSFIMSQKITVSGFEKSLEGEQKWPPVVIKQVPHISIDDESEIRRIKDYGTTDKSIESTASQS
jgi:hypothetical protein